MNSILYFFYIIVALYVLRKIQIRLQLSMAKHPSLTGHSKMSRRISRLVPAYSIADKNIFSVDKPPVEIKEKRQQGFEKLSDYFSTTREKTLTSAAYLEDSISDVAFTRAYRVPFQFSSFIQKHIKTGTIVDETKGNQVKDLDGNWSYDLTGSYGVNVFGYEFYKMCLSEGMEKVKDLGPVLGVYHPIMIENVKLLKEISGLDEVSFHMSGTEAVMQAVRLARYHTGKSHLVRFCGAYHGWWDGVQPGIGNQRKGNDIYTLKEMDKDTLRVLRTRNDIACVLINPVQAMHPNSNPPSDAMLVASSRSAAYDREAYTAWLYELRKVCTERGIVLIMDEIFVGFRLAYRGAQEYFSIKADLVTYGKTIGGGLPIGVVCGNNNLMKRYKEEKPVDICFARGTFNSHPLVMATMNAFLNKIKSDEIQSAYVNIDGNWNQRVEKLNKKLEDNNLPINIVNMVSVWTILFTVPSRYNWMLQFYLRAQGLCISWIGSGRLIMSHDFSEEEYDIVMNKIVLAAEKMKNDGWWWQALNISNKSIKRQVIREFITYFINKKNYF